MRTIATTVATTASLMALGTASLHAIYAPELSRLETSKPWTVAASLRGFYDDNRTTAPDWSDAKQGSWGFEVRPYIGLNHTMDQTYLGLSFMNSSRYYEHNWATDSDAWDIDNEVNLKLHHQFSPRYRLKINDSFLYGVDPDIIGVSTMPLYRSDLSYIRNLGQINFTGELTKTLGFSITYNNNFYDYLDSGPGSYSARLDRMEHVIPIDLRYQVQPDLVAMLGYQFGFYDYTGDSFVDLGQTLPSDSRNAMFHTIYLGADYDVNAQLRASLRGGAMFSSYEDYSSENQWTPYVDASVSYFYTVGSHADLGFRYTVSPTDVAVPSAGVPTLSQEAAAVYLLISHQLTPKLTANVLAQYQWSSFYMGYYDNNHDNLLLLSLYLNYRFNQYLSMEAGYTYDWLDSDVMAGGVELRSYDRNIFYLGLRAQY